jgi:predicted RND superfamily exporter protein
MLVRRPVAWTVVLLTALLAAVAFVMAGQVDQDDDVLAFLPRTNPDIQAFYEINDRFGATDVAIVGLAPGDVFDADFLSKLDAATRALRDTQGLDHVLTLTNVSDFRKDPVAGGVITSNLVEGIPETAEAEAALRERVMSREHIVGTLVSEDGASTVILAFASQGTEPKAIASGVRGVVDEHLAGVPTYWGGAPFISNWIYETTQADMAALTPWAVIAILVIMMAAFRDFLGTVLGLTATVIGIGVSRGLMAALGVSFNIVLSSMPVILFAIGSAYAIHMLSRYDSHAREVGPGPEAVVRTLVGTGPTVFAAGMTTVAGLLSFLMMDIEPMRTFGLFTAIGIFTALILSLTYVPAVMALFPRPVRSGVGGPLMPVMRGLATTAHDKKTVVGAAVVLLFGAGLSLAGAVDTRMDLAAFFEPDTEPAKGQAFLDEHFGGSQFVQVQVEGDLEDPLALREIGRIADRIRTIDLVTEVVAVDDIVSLINDAMTSAKRVPDKSGQVGVLYRFLSSDPSVGRVVTDERDATLLQVRIGSNRADDLDLVLDKVERLVAEEAAASFSVAKRADDAAAVDARTAKRLAARMEAFGRRYGARLESDAEAYLAKLIADRGFQPDTTLVASYLTDFLLSEESWVPLDKPVAARVAGGVAALGPNPDDAALTTAIAQAMEAPEDDMNVGDLLVIVMGPLGDFWRSAVGVAAGGVVYDELFDVTDETRSDNLRAALDATLQDVDVDAALVAGDDAQLTWTVNGMPVLYRGLSRSVTANQFRSLAFALGLVFVIMALLFRSLATGLLATAPTALTLAVIYGGMGAMGVHLDIGTSMLASIIIGAGVDYAVHLLSAWQASDAETVLDGALHAVEETSHGIWTNAIMVAAGFFVLTLGDAKPLQNVGGLTSAAMIAAALSTFLVIPWLARRRRYL